MCGRKGSGLFPTGPARQNLAELQCALQRRDWLKDQTLLAEITRTGSDSTVRASAVQKLNDQAALAEIEGGSGLQGAGSCRLLRDCRRRGQEL